MVARQIAGNFAEWRTPSSFRQRFQPTFRFVAKFDTRSATCLAMHCESSRTKNFTEPQKMFEDRQGEASCFDAVLS